MRRSSGISRATAARMTTAALAGVQLLVAARCTAQYRPTASMAVDSVPAAGIYRIVLPPSFVARCGPDLADIRLIDEKGKEAPYVLKADPQDRFNAGYLPIPDPRILERDSSNRHSYYVLNYGDTYRIDRLSLVITRPALYKRMAVILTASEPDSEARVATITIDPADSVFRLPPVKADRLLIDVSNQDNAPLAISRVATAQSGIYLLTYLERGHAYRLMAGDARASAPDYDLHYFTDSTLLPPVTIGLGPLQQAIAKPGRDLQKNRSDQKRGLLLLWGVITVILLLLLFVSIKLARAIDKKGKE